MKTFTVLVLCIFALCCCQNPEAKGNAGSGGGQKCGNPTGYLEKIRKVCQEKTNATSEDVKSANDFKWRKGKNSSEPNERTKCYMKCTLVEQNEMTENGTPTFEEMEKNYKWATQEIGKCNQINATTSCDSGFNVSVCLANALRIASGCS